MPKNQVHRQIYVFCFIFNSHQTLILIVDCSVRCLFIRIFFIAVIYIAGMCVYRSIQLLKVFQLFSTFDFQYTYVYLVNLLGSYIVGDFVWLGRYLWLLLIHHNHYLHLTYSIRQTTEFLSKTIYYQAKSA